MTVKIKNNDDYFNMGRLESDLKGRAMRGAGATVFTQAIALIIRFCSTMVLARLLTPSDFGLITMVTTFSLLLQSFGITGFTEVIIQKEDINHKMMSTLFWVNISISGALTLLFMATAPVIVWIYKEPRLYHITLANAFSIIAYGMTMLHMALLERNMQFYATSAINLSCGIISVIVTIILAYTGWGYWALVVQTVLWPLSISIFSWTFCKWRPAMPGSYKDLIPLFKFAFHTYGNFTLNYFSRNIDNLLVGWRFGAQSLGIYKKAYDLFVLPAGQIIGPLHSVALATLSRLQNQPDKYRNYYLNSISIIAFIGMPLSAIFTLTGSDIILLVLGPQWTKAGEIFCYFGASIGIMLIYGTQGWLHLSLGRPERWVRWSMAECVITGLFFVAGLPFGIAGVAIAYTVSFYILIWPCLSFAGKPMGLKFSFIADVIWRYFLAALAAGLISFVILYKLAFPGAIFTNLNVFFRIMVSSILCVALYIILIIIFYQSLKPIKQALAIAVQMLPGRNKNK